jgi:ferric-dicitrate binding protein FerR (iron transport regulator)
LYRDIAAALARLASVVIVCTAFAVQPLAIQPATAQTMAATCPSQPGARATQILRCRDGLIIIAEDGARFTLQGHDGSATSVDLQSKALLLDAPKQPGKSRFRVNTPQAIAAVRGTKWAVDVQETRTSVLVLQGRVAVRRPRGGNQVVLGPGEGVDVDPGNEPLAVKRWGQPRVDALLARLGQ